MKLQQGYLSVLIFKNQPFDLALICVEICKTRFGRKVVPAQHQQAGDQ